MKIIKVKDRSDIPDNFTGAVDYPDGTRYWLDNGDWHREDGPAVEDSLGSKTWYWRGDRHREDGPAYVYEDMNGLAYEQWYVFDVEVTKQQHKHYLNLKKLGYPDDICLWVATKVGDR